jgi:hypothetical protein
VIITDQGIEALQRKALDALDSALDAISPHLVELRGGAWAALASAAPDAPRQAAHSGREMVNQVLTLAAPDDAVRAQSWWVPDKTSHSGITRRHRLRYMLSKYRNSESESELLLADRGLALLITANDNLSAMAHARATVSSSQVKDALLASELALRRVLVRDAVRT